MMTSKKIISLVLCAVMIMGTFLSGCGESNIPADTVESVVNLIDEQEKFTYTVIISDSAEEDERAIVSKVTDTIKGLYGAVKFNNDAAVVQDGQREIIIGNTSRKESKDALKRLKKKRTNCAADYLICVDGDNVVINAGSNLALESAAEYFRENILLKKEKTLAADYEVYYAPDITKMTIAGNDISQYGIIVPPSGTVFYDAEVSALVRAILLNCGYEAEVYTSDSEDLPQKAIYIGTTATEEINTDNDKAITFEKDGNLYICSKEQKSVSSGVYTLTKMIEESKDKLEIISGYENVTANLADSDAYRLVWSDEFNGEKLDSNYWVPRVARLEAYNNGNMYYTKNEENISLSKGKLLLTGRWHETEKNSLTSGYIKTEGNLSYQYGYVEILARLPKGNGVWPAFWALGTDTKAYQEIDFFEMFTNNSSRVTAAIHKWWIGLDSSGAEMRGHSSTNEKGRDYDLPNGETFNDDWHTFGCEWTPEEMRFFVDGEHYYTYDISGEGQDIHHTPVYLILCLQIGIAGMAKGVDETTPMPSVYEIEYVRLYQRPSYSKLILK